MLANAFIGFSRGLENILEYTATTVLRPANNRSAFARVLEAVALGTSCDDPHHDVTW